MTTETIICINCGEPHTYDRKRKQKKYCSTKCAASFYGQNMRDKSSQAARVKEHYIHHPEKRFLASTKRSAKLKDIAFNLTEGLLAKLLGPKVCSVTGLPIHSNSGSGSTRGAYSPSIDRLDNAVGYIPSNVRIVSWGYNVAKNKFTDRDLDNLAIALLASHLSANDRKTFRSLLPQNLLAGLPAGYVL